MQNLQFVGPDSTCLKNYTFNSIYNLSSPLSSAISNDGIDGYISLMPEFDIVTGIPKQQDPYFVRALSINNGFKHDVASINISLDENIYSSYIQIGPQNFTFTQN
jgi:hypothetical protein